jgi:ribosomal protein S18 acetylase RimI-like enzyme
MHIREFSKKDTKAVIALWHECGLIRPWNDPVKDIERKFSFQPELFLVGEIDNAVIATAMAGYDGHRGSVFYLAVSVNKQKSGYGKQLMDRIEALLIEKGCPKLNIVVRSSNYQVLDFYSSLDYLPDEVASIGKRLIPDGND